MTSQEPFHPDTIAWGHISGFPWLPVYICDPRKLRPKLHNLGDRHRAIQKVALKEPDQWYLVYWLGSGNFSLVKKNKNLIRPWNGPDHASFLKGQPFFSKKKKKNKNHLVELNKGIDEAKICLGDEDNPNNDCRIIPIHLIASDLNPDVEPPSNPDNKHISTKKDPVVTKKRKISNATQPEVLEKKKRKFSEKTFQKELHRTLNDILRNEEFNSRKEVRKECEVRLNMSLKKYKSKIVEISNEIIKKIEDEDMKSEETEENLGKDMVPEKAQEIPSNFENGNVHPQVSTAVSNTGARSDFDIDDSSSKSPQLELNELVEIQKVLEMDGYVKYKLKAIQRMMSCLITRKQAVESGVGLSITKLRKSKEPQLVEAAGALRLKWKKEWA